MVLFVSYSGAFGGAERSLVQWASALAGERAIACPEGNFAAAARAAGVRVFPIRARSLALRGGVREPALAAIGLASHRRELGGLVERLDPDVLVLCGMRSAIAGLAFAGPAAGRRGVCFVHADMVPGPAIGQLVRRAAGRSELVLVPSRAVATDLDPGGALGERLQIVEPGIDVARFNSEAPPAVPPQVLVLGWISASKRPELALEALARARRARPELRLRVAGEPVTAGDQELAAALRRRAERPDLAGAVELLGALDDPAPELARATCLLHCAPREPFGIAVVEALAAGRPAVVPDAGGPVEIVDSTCAITYPAGDADAAADALVRLASDPELCARMGAAGRERARERFGIERSRRRWAEAVDRIKPVADRPRAGGRLEIVTVTHNSAAMLPGLLASVEQHLPGVPVQVVDCASVDETLEVARRFPAAAVIALGRNVGFGSGCNVGVRAADAPVLALLNPDVELLDSSLLALAAEFERDDRPERLLAPLVLNPDGTPQDSVHPEPGSPADLIGSVLSPSLVPVPVLAPWRSGTPRRVGWAVGCALLARAGTLRVLGPFDERLFMYGEDLDLGLRARRRGVETWFWPYARVIHHRAHASSSAFGGEPFELLARARRQVVTRRLGQTRAAVDDRAQEVTFASRIAVKGALGRSTARERRQLEALRASRRDA